MVAALFVTLSPRRPGEPPARRCSVVFPAKNPANSLGLFLFLATADVEVFYDFGLASRMKGPPTMPSPALELPCLLKEFETRSRDLRPDLMLEFDRRVRMLEREYARHLMALLREFQSRSRVLDNREGACKKDPKRVRQSKEGWLRKVEERNSSH